MFQSPKSGKFESNEELNATGPDYSVVKRFNPLNRGNLNQIHVASVGRLNKDGQGFNPLNRGNLNQIRLN